MCRVHVVCLLYSEADLVDQRAIFLFSPAFWKISSVSTSRSLKGSLVCSRSALACNRCRTSVAVVRLIFNSRANFAEDLPCSTSRMNRTVCSSVKYLPSNTFHYTDCRCLDILCTDTHPSRSSLSCETSWPGLVPFGNADISTPLDGNILPTIGDRQRDPLVL